MQHPRFPPIRFLLSTLLTLAIGVPLASAQGRMNDKDIESLMNNLQKDAKAFRSAFNSSVGKSTIRKTSQEKDAKTLVKTFDKQTESMYKQFKSKKKADAQLAAMQSSADQIDKLLTSTPMGDETSNAWAKVKNEVTMLSQQFNKAP
jgi:hypothetical protein